MKHNKSVAYIFWWKTPVTWPKYWHWFFSIFRGYLSLKHRYKDWNTLFCLHWEMKGKQKKCTTILKCVKILFFVRSLRGSVSQNLYCQYLIDFNIFLARKYASFGHSAYCRNHYERLSHLREKYSKSLPKILSIFTCRQHKFSRNVLVWSIYLSIMETTGWKLSIGTCMCFVLVYCCLGMLMKSYFWGAKPIFKRKKITLSETLDPTSC